MSEMQKITAHVPAELLRSAQEATGKGITDTVKEGLEALARSDAYRKLRSLRGKLPLDIDLKELRRDRR